MPDCKHCGYVIDELEWQSGRLCPSCGNDPRSGFDASSYVEMAEIGLVDTDLVIPGDPEMIRVPFLELAKVQTDSEARKNMAGWIESPRKPQHISGIADDLISILLGHTWEWTEFDESFQQFRQTGYFPDTWQGLEYSPDRPSEETQQRLASFAQLSHRAKQVVFDTGTITRKSPKLTDPYEATRQSDMVAREIRAAIAELSQRGFAVADVPISERLQDLKKDELKDIAEEYQIPQTGTKAELSARLTEEVGEDVLLQYLPPNKREELWSVGPVFGDLDDPYIEYELQRIRVLGWTVRNLMVNIRRLAAGIPCVVQANRQCPICVQHDGQLIALSQEFRGVAFPPFHPGCRCDIIQDTSQLQPTEPSSRAGCTTILVTLFTVCSLLIYFLS